VANCITGSLKIRGNTLSETTAPSNGESSSNLPP